MAEMTTSENNVELKFHDQLFLFYLCLESPYPHGLA